MYVECLEAFFYMCLHVQTQVIGRVILHFLRIHFNIIFSFSSVVFVFKILDHKLVAFIISYALSILSVLNWYW